MNNKEEMRKQFEEWYSELLVNLKRGADSYYSPDNTQKSNAEFISERWIGFRQGYQAAQESMQAEIDELKVDLRVIELVKDQLHKSYDRKCDDFERISKKLSRQIQSSPPKE